MLTIALTLLIASSGLFALGSIASTLYNYGPAVLRLRQELRQISRNSQLPVIIAGYRPAPRMAAEILRPDFSGPIRAPQLPWQKPLRAAA